MKVPGVGCQVSGPDTRHPTPDTYEVHMPKQKSKRALRKRVRLTGRGRLRRHRPTRATS